MLRYNSIGFQAEDVMEETKSSIAVTGTLTASEVSLCE
jgi:hypothetical protein